MKNVIFILSDQHNAKALQCQNHVDIKTPNLDALAQDAILFDRAICQSPICTPSRISWISGQYAHNHNYYGLEGENPNGLPTVFSHFRTAGYQTGAIGKIHCPEYWVEDDCDTFMEVRGCSIGKNPEFQNYLKENQLDKIADEVVIAQTGYHGHGQCVDGMPSKLDYAHSQEKFIVDSCVSFMEESKKNDKPFFLHASFGKPHQPYIPAKEFWDLYPEESLTLPPNIEYDNTNKAPQFKRMQAFWKENQDWLAVEPKDMRHGMLRKLRGYYGCISQVDHAVGELVDYLKDNGLLENTIIVYSSDHGDYACEHSMLEKAPGICSDAICRIPLIIRDPDAVRNNTVVHDIVESVDIVPTLCTLTGLGQLESADGTDISDYFAAPNMPARDETTGLTEFPWSKSIYKGNYRFVYYPKASFADEYPNGFGELYDLVQDPWEMNNLYFEPEHQTLITQMREELLEKLITSTRVRTMERVSLEVTDQRKIRYGKGSNFDGKFSIKQLKDTEKLTTPSPEMYL